MYTRDGRGALLSRRGLRPKTRKQTGEAELLGRRLQAPVPAGAPAVAEDQGPPSRPLLSLRRRRLLQPPQATVRGSLLLFQTLRPLPVGGRPGVEGDSEATRCAWTSG